MINIKKIKPRYTQILLTANEYENDVINGGLIDTTKTKGTLKEYQTVVAMGVNVRDIQVGDVVLFNPRRYAVKKHQEGSLKDGIITDNPVIRYEFPMVELDGKSYLLVEDIDIKFVIEDYEETPDNIIVPDSKIIL